MFISVINCGQWLEKQNKTITNPIWPSARAESFVWEGEMRHKEWKRKRGVTFKGELKSNTVR